MCAHSALDDIQDFLCKLGMKPDTVKLRVLTHLVGTYMQAFFGLLMKGIFNPYVLTVTFCQKVGFLISNA